jgi:hypothetical protein
MITELVLLLGALVFLGIRNDYVKRSWALVAAIFCWGGARFFTEMGFADASRYNWGSLPAYLAAACLLFCVLLIFCACRTARSASSGGSKTFPAGSGVADQQKAAAGSDLTGKAPSPHHDPEVKLRQLVK